MVAKAKRRHASRSAEYKLRILRELEACKGKGEEVGALLRREGLYSSLVSKWREQRERGRLTGAGRRRGRQADPKAVELARLQRENQRLKEELERAELIIEVQKKVAQLVGTTPASKNESN